jgi:hypothetical protein
MCTAAFNDRAPWREEPHRRVVAAPVSLAGVADSRTDFHREPQTCTGLGWSQASRHILC